MIRVGDEVGKIRLRTRFVEVGTAFVEVGKVRLRTRFVEAKGSEL